MHIFTKFSIGNYSVCRCCTSFMAVEHFLQDCQTQQTLGAETWPADTAVREELFDPVEILQRTAAYVLATGVSVETLKRTVAYVPATGVPVGANDDDEVFALNFKKKEWVDSGSEFRSCVKVEVAVLGFPS